MAEDITTDCLLFTVVVGVVSLVAFLRVFQGVILQYRETGSLLTRYPDTPAMRHWHHVNNVLFGSICLAVGLAGTIYFLYAAWWGSRNGVEGWHMYLWTLPVPIFMILFGVLGAWRSLPQRPWK
jgi:sterol desaturase/sphingolipid hydroxylase (fatty acid hydroxylase superfamily)